MLMMILILNMEKEQILIVVVGPLSRESFGILVVEKMETVR